MASRNRSQAAELLYSGEGNAESGYDDLDTGQLQSRTEPANIARVSTSLAPTSATELSMMTSIANSLGSLGHIPAGADGRESVETGTVYQILVPLNAEQLARLWLREPTLSQSNVLAWSEEASDWIPVFKNHECAKGISKVRVDAVRMLSALYGAHASTNVPAPAPARRRQASNYFAELGPLTELDKARYLALPALQAAPPVRNDGARLADHTAAIVKRAALWVIRRRMVVQQAIVEVLCRLVQRSRPRIERFHLGHFAVSFGVSFIFGLSLSYLATLVYQHHHSVRLHSLRPTTAPLQRPASAKQSFATPNDDASKSALTPGPQLAGPPILARAHESISLPANPRSKASGIPISAPTHIFLAPPQTEQNISSREVSRAIDLAIRRASACAESDLYGTFVVTFDTAGAVQSAGVERFSGDSTQRTCLLSILAQLKISPFLGDKVTVRKSFHVHERGT